MTPRWKPANKNVTPWSRAGARIDLHTPGGLAAWWMRGTVAVQVGKINTATIRYDTFQLPADCGRAKPTSRTQENRTTWHNQYIRAGQDGVHQTSLRISSDTGRDSCGGGGRKLLTALVLTVRGGDSREPRAASRALGTGSWELADKDILLGDRERDCIYLYNTVHAHRIMIVECEM